MRRWLFIALGVALVGVGVALMRGQPESAAPAEAPPAATLPEFAPVEVRAEGEEGLALSGRVVDARGQPVAGAQVFLSASAERTLVELRCEECGQALLSCQAHESARHVLALLEQGRGLLQARMQVSTDEQGRFRFERLRGVSFNVWAQAPGHGLALRERAAPGEAVELYLPPLRSLEGEVVDEAGEGVVGARVYVVSRKVPLLRQVVAGAGGRFRAEGLGEGPFFVLAVAEGRVPAAEPLAEAGGLPVRLRLERARTLEVRVVRKGAPAEAVVRLVGDHLSREARTQQGRVRLEGLASEEVVVSAEAAGGRLGSVPRAVVLEQPVTQVVLELEEAGTLLVTVVDEAGQPVPTPRLELQTVHGQVVRSERAATGALVVLGPLAVGEYVLEGKAEGYKEVRVPARVVAGEVPLELELARALEISGRVLDVYGRPAPGVSVLVQPTGEVAHADEQGRFRASVPTPGLYTLLAHHSDWGGGERQVTAPAEGVELALEPRAALEVVVSSQGRRVEGAEVMLLKEGEGVFRSDVPSGADGVVPMRGLPAGEFWLVATHRDYPPSQRQQVSVADGQVVRVEVELQPGAVLAGEVVDTRGLPVEGATLSVLPRLAEPVTSDTRGRFEFRGLRPEGTYRVEARHPGHDQKERVVGKAGGERVKVVMEPRQLFRGRVVEANGTPVRHFRVDGQEVTSADGRFELALKVEEGVVVAEVEARGFEPLLVDRPADQRDWGDLVLERAPVVEGLVREESGAPVADAVVECDACEGSVRSGPDGRFELPSPAYVARFSVTARKGRLSGAAQATRDGGRRVELVLRPATRLYGRVYQGEGQPAAGQAIEGLHVERGESVSIVTGPDGSYEALLAPGSYRFAMAGTRQFSGEPMLMVQVGGGEQRLDMGPVPGTASLAVRVRPERGRALWLVAGEVGAVAEPMQELMRVRWGQVVFQPRGEQVVLRGLPPGRYTVVWAGFRPGVEGEPVVRRVDVPGTGEVVLE